MNKTLKIKRLNPVAIIPTRATGGSAGFDLYACISEEITISPSATVVVPTGISIELPSNELAAFIYARSGLGIKHGIAPANCVGVIDSDYRGEIMVGLHNSSQKNYTINPNDRIAQMVIAPVFLPEIEEVDALEITDRSDGGFGSSGR